MDKGSRPSPQTSLPREHIAEHLAKFDDGATRFTNGFMNGISKPADLTPGDTLERITFRNAAGKPVNG